MAAGLGLILVAAMAFVLAGAKNVPALLPYVGVALVLSGVGSALLVASLRLPVARAR